MFQTKFDRWLIEKFVYDYHILVFQLPEKLPFGVKKVKLPVAGKAGYQYRLEISNSKKADKIIAGLKEKGRSFKTMVVEGDHWYNWLIHNKRKSFSFRVFWWVNMSLLLFFGISALIKFSRTEKFAEMKEAVQEVLRSSK